MPSHYLNQCLVIVNWTLRRNFSEILIKIQIFSFTEMHLKISTAKCQPFCPGGDELRRIYTTSEILFRASESKLGGNELIFRFYTDLSPCPRFLSHTPELVTKCRDFFGRGHPSSSEVVQCTCSKPPVHVNHMQSPARVFWSQIGSCGR